MDICLIKQNEWTNVHPTSIIGMLWLQTHFEDEHWLALSKGQVQLSKEDSTDLSFDAKKADLTLNIISSLSITPKF